MKPVVRLFVAACAGLIALGASPQPQTAHANRPRQTRPSFIDQFKFKRYTPNAIRRASLAFLTPRHLSAARMTSVAHEYAATVNSSYKVINLEALIKGSGVIFDPLALNNAGQIVGETSHSGGQEEPGYLINPSGSHGALATTGAPYNGYNTDYPVSISNNGKTVAGVSDLTIETYDSYTYYTVPVIWTLSPPTSSVVHSYGMYDAGSSFAPGFTNTSNYITLGGNRYVDNTTLDAAYFSVLNCQTTDFEANAVNDSGLIVGSSSQNHYRAEVLTLGGCPTYVPNVGGNYSVADAVNANGDMIVFAYRNYYLWSKGRLYPIPLPSGYDASKYNADPIGLNASDVIVGNIYNKGGALSGTFIYVNGKSTDLQSLFPPNSGWISAFAIGINDEGEIIGQGYLNKVLTPFALQK